MARAIKVTSTKITSMEKARSSSTMVIILDPLRTERETVQECMFTEQEKFTRDIGWTTRKMGKVVYNSPMGTCTKA